VNPPASSAGRSPLRADPPSRHPRVAPGLILLAASGRWVVRGSPVLLFSGGSLRTLPSKCCQPHGGNFPRTGHRYRSAGKEGQCLGAERMGLREPCVTLEAVEKSMKNSPFENSTVRHVVDSSFSPDLT
jgi:hypothetical protein